MFVNIFQNTNNKKTNVAPVHALIKLRSGNTFSFVSRVVCLWSSGTLHRSNNFDDTTFWHFLWTIVFVVNYIIMHLFCIQILLCNCSFTFFTGATCSAVSKLLCICKLSLYVDKHGMCAYATANIEYFNTIFK